MSFDQLGLAPELLRAVAQQGYTEPTPVQGEAIPLVLAGRDLLAGAQTGTGKTAAFVLPILQRLHAIAARRPARASSARSSSPRPASSRSRSRRASAPTAPSARSARPPSTAASASTRRSARCAPAPRSWSPRPAGCSTTSASARSTCRAVEILVLDEADRMLDMGFIRDIRKILALLPPRRQNLLFSATFSDEIRRLADGLLARPGLRPGHAAQHRRRARRRRSSTRSTASASASCSATSSSPAGSTRRSSSRAPSTAPTGSPSSSRRDGITATAIHGNKSQPQRVRALDDFKAGRSPILVATDIAARGLDIDALPHVVNYELPMVPEDYVHRIGRTGRAGIDGDAISLVCVDEAKLLHDIERVLGRRDPVRGRSRASSPIRASAPSRSCAAAWAGARPIAIDVGAGAPRHGAAHRVGGGPRPAGVPHHATPVPRDIRGPAVGGGPRPSARPLGTGGGPRTRPATRPAPRGSHPGNRGAGFAGPRRPGQGIGNGSGPRPASGGAANGPPDGR